MCVCVCVCVCVCFFFFFFFFYLRQSSVRAVLTTFRFNRSLFMQYERMVESYQGLSLGRISTAFSNYFITHVCVCVCFFFFFFFFFFYLRQSSVRAVLTTFRFNRSLFMQYERMVESYQGLSLGRISTALFGTHSWINSINFDVNCSQANRKESNDYESIQLPW